MNVCQIAGLGLLHFPFGPSLKRDLQLYNPGRALHDVRVERDKYEKSSPRSPRLLLGANATSPRGIRAPFKRH